MCSQCLKILNTLLLKIPLTKGLLFARFNLPSSNIVNSSGCINLPCRVACVNGLTQFT